MNGAAKMQWVFLGVFLALTLGNTTDLSASSFNATEIAKCMVAKSPYSGSFPRWEYADYCSGRALTDTEKIMIQCEMDELTIYPSPVPKNFGADTFTLESCKCFPEDYYGWGSDDDDLERRC
jgi:hypothetical protein